MGQVNKKQPMSSTFAAERKREAAASPLDEQTIAQDNSARGDTEAIIKDRLENFNRWVDVRKKASKTA